MLEAEVKRAGHLGWYRNPSRACEEALRVAYMDSANQWRQMVPDFLFFSDDGNGGVRVSVVDPHSIDYADALPKLRGTADFAEQFGDDSIASSPSARWTV